jgi:3',5'-nucleoside bisphosphate phosphatase
MLREYIADLHIHSCLSPCASLDLSPRAIVERSRSEHLDIIAVTDHNTTKNVEVIMRLGEENGVKVIPALEVQSREEIHLLTLFPDWTPAAAWGEEVYLHLPAVRNNPDYFGDQPVLDRDGNILEFEDRLLLNSIDLSLNEILERVAGQGGVVIPSHFDKDSFSLISQLGLIPEGIHVAALEMSRGGHRRNRADSDAEIPRISSSDAHRLAEIGTAHTVFLLERPSLPEICLALRGEGGRRIVRRVDRKNEA